MKKSPVVVITGGTRGIGYETGRALAMDGWRIALCARDQESASDVAEELSERYSTETYGAVADVASQISVRHFADEVNSRFEAVNLLICNAAVLGPVGKLVDVQRAELGAAFMTNVMGVVNSIDAFWDQLVSAEGFRIIVLAGGGLGGPNPLERALAYVPSKAAVVSIVELLSNEVEQAGGTINAVAPGNIPTTFMDPILCVDQETAGAQLVSQIRERANGSIDASIQDFLAMVRYLVLPGSSHINGRILSAKWDRIDQLSSLQKSDISDNLFRLRRIDESLFSEAAE